VKEIVSWRARLSDGIDLIETATSEEAKANARVGMTRRRQVSKMVNDNCAYGGGRGTSRRTV
jgi:hypothetical protein